MLNLRAIRAVAESEDWGEHPYTLHFLRELNASVRPRALRKLLAKCSVSEDADVRAAFTEYQAVEEMHRFFRLEEPQGEEGEEVDDKRK